VFWSNSNNNVQHETRTLEAPTLSSILDKAAWKHEVVVFLKSDTSPIDFNSIKEFIKNSNAKIMTSVYHGKDGMSIHDNILNADVMKDSNNMSLDEFRSHINSQKSMNNGIFSNNRPDAYEIQLNGDNNEGAILKEISSTSPRPILFVASKEPSVELLLAPSNNAEYSNILHSRARLLATSASNSTSNYTVDSNLLYKPEGAEYSIYYASTFLYITPDLFTGIMTGLFIFFVLLTGVSCLNAIQGHETFASKQCPVGKEA
jgi:hypothetical protein